MPVKICKILKKHISSAAEICRKIRYFFTNSRINTGKNKVVGFTLNKGVLVMLDISERLSRQLEFIIEIDKMKQIYRQTWVTGEDRKENDAEHSWHLGILAFLLSEYANEKIDVLHTIKMVLIHDIVEIDAGDTYCYDKEGYKTKALREGNAANRIFGILPDDQKDEIYKLWREFEEELTPESRFAAVIDKLQPLLLNYTRNGIGWKEHNIKKQQVMDRYVNADKGSKELYDCVKKIIEDAVNQGLLQG